MALSVLFTFVMEPFSPQDPVSRLLGSAKQVEPRPNFTQNVMRAVRQLPQQESTWDRMKDSLSRWLAPRPLMGTACALLAVVMTGTWVLKSSHGGGGSSETAQTTSSGQTHLEGEPEVLTELDQMDQFNQLLAQQDTKSLSDNDLAALLY